jgi:type II secretory ATPase GspE/PulE/Tfp pilus assembly ATPase PilB-like protein
MGMAPSLVAAGTSLIISQRLIPKICPACKGSGKQGKTSCPLFGGRGRKGRAAVFECLPMTDTVRDKVRSGMTKDLIREMRRAGQSTLETSIQRLAGKGVISRKFIDLGGEGGSS